MKALFLSLFFVLLVHGAALGQTRAGQPIAFGLALHGLPVTAQKLKALQCAAGLPVSMVVFFLQWPELPENIYFPRDSLEAISDFGAVPVITWEPMYLKDGQEKVIPAKEILGGKYDRYIENFARASKEYVRPVIIRFGHEMNLSRYHWGTPDGYGPENTGLYKNMFRHVVKIFRKAGAANAYFAFCPNAESIPNTSFDPAAGWNKISAYYPGDEYVDVLGMDGYNWGLTRTREKHGWTSSFRSFAGIFSDCHHELKKLNKDKPLIVFETASAPSGGDKGLWIAEAFEQARAWGITALNWFEADKEVDWRFAGSCDGGCLKRVKEQVLAPRLMQIFMK